MDDGDANGRDEEEVDELQSEEDVSTPAPTPLNHFCGLTRRRMSLKRLPQNWLG